MVKLEQSDKFSVPHVDWNNIKMPHEKPIVFEKLSQNPHFYFDHSYHFKCLDPNHILVKVDYNVEVTAAVLKDNIYGV